MATTDPKAKKVPSGTLLFKVLSEENSKNILTAPPNIIDKNSPTQIKGQPKLKPKNNKSLMSPKPIHLPLETCHTKKKGKAAAMPAAIPPRKNDLRLKKEFG